MVSPRPECAPPPIPWKNELYLRLRKLSELWNGELASDINASAIFHFATASSFEAKLMPSTVCWTVCSLAVSKLWIYSSAFFRSS